jgi:hypothetical protein
MKVRKMPLRYGDGLEGQACGVVDLAPQAQAVMLLESLCHTNLDEIIRWVTSLLG